MWGTSAEELQERQRELAAPTEARWQPPEGDLRVGGCWVCFPRGQQGPGAAGDPAWTAAVTWSRGRVCGAAVRTAVAGAEYVAGLMALREGPLLEQAVRGLRERPQVLLVDATGRDHPRGCGLARHLGAVLDLPTVGVTHRPLAATGDWPADEQGAASPLWLGGERVGCWLRTRTGTRPLAVHPGWRVDLDTALRVLAVATAGRRTPEPLRHARRLARRARSRAAPERH
jgi:deoxyribonuclease V